MKHPQSYHTPCDHLRAAIVMQALEMFEEGVTQSETLLDLARLLVRLTGESDAAALNPAEAWLRGAVAQGVFTEAWKRGYALACGLPRDAEPVSRTANNYLPELDLGTDIDWPQKVLEAIAFEHARRTAQLRALNAGRAV